MSRIAECNGFELLEEGPRLLFVERRTDNLLIAIFVAVLVAVLTSMNAFFQIVLAISGKGFPGLAAILALVAAAAVTLAVYLNRARKARMAGPPKPHQIALVIDRDQGAIVDAAGQTVAPLDGVMFRSVFQVGSSSKALELCFAGGTRIIARGSPFGGSVEELIGPLRQRGFRVVD